MERRSPLRRLRRELPSRAVMNAVVYEREDALAARAFDDVKWNPRLGTRLLSSGGRHTSQVQAIGGTQGPP
jgi:hypothetical protein